MNRIGLLKKHLGCNDVPIYQYRGIIFDIPLHLMRIPVYCYTIAVPCFILVRHVWYNLSYARKSLIEHTPDCAISSLPVFIFLG